MAIIGGGSGTDWYKDQEEERRRLQEKRNKEAQQRAIAAAQARARAAAQQQQAATGQGPKPLTPLPDSRFFQYPKVNPQTQKTIVTPPAPGPAARPPGALKAEEEDARAARSMRKTPTAQVDKVVAAAEDFIHRQDQAAVSKDPLEYWKRMERALGVEGLDARVQGVYDIYMRHLQPLDGKDLVFDMIKSPFKLDTLEAMAREAGLVTNNKLPTQQGYILPDRPWGNMPPGAQLAQAMTGTWQRVDDGPDSRYIGNIDPLNPQQQVGPDDELGSKEIAKRERWDQYEKWWDEYRNDTYEGQQLLQNLESYLPSELARKNYTSEVEWEKQIKANINNDMMLGGDTPTAKAFEKYVQGRTSWISQAHGSEQNAMAADVAKDVTVEVLTWAPWGKALKLLQYGGRAVQWLSRAKAAANTAKVLETAAKVEAEGTLAVQGAEKAIKTVQEGTKLMQAAADAQIVAEKAATIAQELKKAGRFVPKVIEAGEKGYYLNKGRGAGIWGFNKLMGLTRGGYFLWKSSNIAGGPLQYVQGDARAAAAAETERESLEMSMKEEEMLEADPYTSQVQIDVATMGMGTEEQMTRSAELYAKGELLESYMFQQLALNNTDEIIKWQNKIKEAQVDPLTGAALRDGYAQDLVADGIMTPEWWAELRKYYRDQERDTADVQMQLKAEHFATEDMEITGSMMKWDFEKGEWVTDERWQKAFDNAQEEWARQTNFGVDHPILSVIQSATKFPMTEHGWKAMWNQMSGEGKFYIPLKLMSTVALKPGELWNGQMGALDLMARMGNNPVYQGMKEDIIQAVEQQGKRREVMAPTSPEVGQMGHLTINAEGMWDMGIGEAMDLIESGEVDTSVTVTGDRTLGDLVKAFKATEAEMLEQTHGADYISTLGNFFGGDYEGIRRWTREHPDLTHGINMTTDIIAQVLLMKGGAAIRRPVRRNVNAFNKSFRVNRDVSRVVREINNGMAHRAARVMGGSAAKEIVQTLMRERYRNPTKDMPDMVNAHKDMAAIIKRTDLTEAQKMQAVAERFPDLAVPLKNGSTFARVVIKDWEAHQTKQAEKTAHVEAGHEGRRAAEVIRVRDRYRELTEGQAVRLKQTHEGQTARMSERYERELNRRDTSADTKLEKTRTRVEGQRAKKLAEAQSKLDSDIGLARQRMEAEITKIRAQHAKRKIKAPERDRLIEEQRSAFKEYETTLREGHTATTDRINAPFDTKIAEAEAATEVARAAINREVSLRRIDDEIAMAVRHDREMLELYDRHIYQENIITERKMAKWDANHPVPDSTLIDFDTRLMQRMVARQKGRGDIIGKKTFSLDEMKARLAEYYAGRYEQARNPLTNEPLWMDPETKTIPQMNTAKTYYDIFPHLTLPGLKRPSTVRMAVESFLMNGKNWGPLKPLMEAMYTPLLRAPALKADTLQAGFAERIFDFVATYSGSIAHAEAWANRAALTDFSNASQIRAFEAALHADKARYVTTGEMHSSLAQRVEDFAGRSAAEMDPMVGDQGPTQIGTKFTAPVKGDIDKLIRQAEKSLDRARTPQDRKAAAEALNQLMLDSGRVGAWKSKSGASGQVTMGTTKMKYTVALGRDVMWASIKTLDGTDAFGHALNFTRTNHFVVQVRNVYRASTAAMQTFSTPLRIWSVGSGALNLFGKHSMADTMRSLVDEGLSVTRYHAHRKALEASLEKIDPQVRQKVLTDIAASMEGEYHFDTEGGQRLVWTQAKAFSQRGRLQHRRESIQAIRNIVQDKGFMIYHTGGLPAVGKWLNSADGINYLTETGAVKRAREMYEEADVPLTKAENIQLAREQYINDMVRLFEDYSTHKNLYADMVKMGKGEVVPLDGNIEAALTNAYSKSGGLENPTLEISFEKGKTGTATMIRLTKAGMLPNRVNRALVFHDIYAKTYKRLKKDGLSDNEAALISSGVARIRTQQVHFDLSAAMKFEAKNRWYAWFGTKHRLWTTWLLKTAATKPLYAAAFNEFANWMQERNDDPSIPPWEKYNIKVPIGGDELSINMAPWLWMTSYAQESIIGYALQNEIIGGFNAVFNTNIQAAPREFDFSLTRLDAPIRAISRRIHLGEVQDTDGVAKALENMDEADRQKMQRNMYIIYVDSGYTKSWVDCYREVVVGGIVNELTRLAKPASSQLLHSRDLKRREQEAAYAAMTDPKKKMDYLNANPDFAAIIGARDRLPWDQAEIAQYYKEIRELDERTEAEFDTIWRTKGVFTQDVVQNAHLKYNTERDAIGEKYPKGLADATTYGADEITKIIKFFLPDTKNAEAWRKEVSIPTDYEEQQKRKELTENFQNTMLANGIDPNSPSMGVRVLKQRMIEDKLDDFMKRNTGSYTYGEENNARWLARSTYSTETGLIRQSQYLEALTSNKKREILVRGLKNGKADKNNLMAIFASPDELEYVGIPTDPETEQAKLEVAMAKQKVDDRLDAAGIERQSKQGKAAYAEVDAVIAQHWNLPNFRAQMSFSLMNTVERMQALGFDKGNTGASQGWHELFTIVNQVWDIAANEYNQNTKSNGVSIRTAQNGVTHPESAAKIKKLMAQIVALQKKNKDWFTEWQLMDFGLTKFGFYREIGDNSDVWLWGEHAAIDLETYNEQWGAD